MLPNSPDYHDYDQEPQFEIIPRPFKSEMNEHILDGKTVMGLPDPKPELQIPLMPGQDLNDLLEQILYSNLEERKKDIPPA